MIFTMSIIITIVLYALIAYMSFITASILHTGVIYRLAVPVIKSLVFIALCYISIISDVLLFNGTSYNTIVFKNGLLLLLVAASLYNARKGKETNNEHS